MLFLVTLSPLFMELGTDSVFICSC